MIVNADGSTLEAGDIDVDDQADDHADWPTPAAPAEDRDGPTQGDPRDDDL